MRDPLQPRLRRALIEGNERWNESRHAGGARKRAKRRKHTSAGEATDD